MSLAKWFLTFYRNVSPASFIGLWMLNMNVTCSFIMLGTTYPVM